MTDEGAGRLSSREPVRTTRLTRGGQAVLFAAVALLAVWGDRFVVAVPAALALAVVCLSIVYAWAQGRALGVTDAEPLTLTVGESGVVAPVLVNRSRLLAVRDVILHQRGPAGYVPVIEPGSEEQAAVAFRPRRRGRLSSFKFVATTSFPFGLAEARVALRAPADILVLPRPGTVRKLRDVVALDGIADFRGTGRRAGEGEFHGLREWREGEGMRRVHWKMSARRGRPVLSEFVHEHRPPVHLVLQLAVRRHGWRASFERAVGITTTLAEHLLRHGHRVRLSLAGTGGRTLDQVTGRSGLVVLQTALADARAEPSKGAADPADGVPTSGRSREAMIVVHAGGLILDRDESTAKDASWTLLDVDDPAVRTAFSRVRGPSPTGASQVTS